MTTQTKVERRTQTDTDDRPPDIGTIHDRYQRGELSDAEMEAAVKTAMEAYPPDGKRQSRMSLLEAADVDERRFAAKLIVALIVGFGLAALFSIITPPPAIPL